MLLFGTTYCERGNSSLLMHSKESQKGYIKGSLGFSLRLLLFSLRLQLVDGRRFDAFVAYPHFSRVHGGASPIVAYVSALLVRVRVCEYAYVLRCQFSVWACLWGVPVFLRVCVHCVLVSKGKEGEEVEPNGALRAYEC